MSALDELFWRDEILQALFWMRGEGLADTATAPDLARFLATDETLVATTLARLTEEGYVERASSTLPLAAAPDSPTPPLSPYRLTPLGVREGGRRFQDEFAGLTQQAHGECGPGCWCQDPEREGEPCPSQPREEPERVPA